jgi:protein arginine kinase
MPRTGTHAVKLKQTGPWIEHSGPDADVVVSSRARLARNLSGLPFVNQASDAEKREVLQLVQTLPLAGDASS